LELLIAWDTGKLDWGPEFEFYEIDEQNKVLPRATRVIVSLHGKEIQTILLKDIVDELKTKTKNKK